MFILFKYLNFLSSVSSFNNDAHREFYSTFRYCLTVFHLVKFGSKLSLWSLEERQHKGSLDDRVPPSLIPWRKALASPLQVVRDLSSGAETSSSSTPNELQDQHHCGFSLDFQSYERLFYLKFRLLCPE